MPLMHDPIELFRRWFEEARAAEAVYPDAMTLATVDPEGNPDARIVLLKEFDGRGFVFYTNYHSAKGRQLLAHRRAALCLYWKSTGRQVRVRGPVEEVEPARADAYFATRPRGSQLGAWASRQSEVIADRDMLLGRYHEFEAMYADRPVPRPPHWSGFSVIPEEMEFWSEGTYRLHNRRLYRRKGDGWEVEILSP